MAQWANAVNLCGIVTRIPSTFAVAVSAAMTTARSPSGTCIGMHTPAWPRSPKVRVSRTGDSAYLTGSPMIGYSRVAPWSWLDMSILARLPNPVRRLPAWWLSVAVQARNRNNCLGGLAESFSIALNDDS